MKQFTTAARRGASGMPNAVDVQFEWEVREGEFVTMTAHPPTSGQLALFLADQASGGRTSIRALFDFIASILGQADYDIIENQLRDGLDVQVAVELVEYLSAEWGARPTKPASDSSSSPPTTGKKSTGKHRAGASTTSTSALIAS